MVGLTFLPTTGVPSLGALGERLSTQLGRCPCGAQNGDAVWVWGAPPNSGWPPEG